MRHRAEIGYPLMKPTPVDPYNHVGIWKQGSQLFERFGVLIFGICHIDTRSMARRLCTCSRLEFRGTLGGRGLVGV